MKNTKTLFLKMSIFFLLTTSCFTVSYAQYYNYYTPNEGSTLALSEKNSLKGSFAVDPINLDYVKTDREINYVAALGYSPIKYLAIQSSFYKYGILPYYRRDDINRTGYMANVAIGTYYFHPTKTLFRRKKDLKKLGIRNGWLFDFYAGLGRGTVYNFYYNNGPYAHFKFIKPFAQFGVHWRGRVVLGYTFKLANIDYNKVTFYQYHRINEWDKELVGNFLLENPFILKEHTIKVHFGSRYSRLYGSMVLQFSDRRRRIENGAIFLGVMIDIQKLYTEKLNSKSP